MYKNITYLTLTLRQKPDKGKNILKKIILINHYICDNNSRVIWYRQLSPKQQRQRPDHLKFLFTLRPPGVPERPAYMHLPLPLSLPPSPQIGNVALLSSEFSSLCSGNSLNTYLLTSLQAQRSMLFPHLLVGFCFMVQLFGE